MTAKDALAARLLATFLGEFEAQLRVMNADLLALEGQPADAERLKSLFRVAHTLKGAARAADVPEVERACHALESLLALARDGKLALEATHFAQLFGAADALGEAHARLVAGKDLARSALDRVAQDLGAARPPRVGARVAEQPAPASVPDRRRSDAEVRVRVEMLDALLGSAGQLFVASSRTANRPAEAQGLSEAVGRAAADWRRSGRRIRIALDRAGAPRSAVQVVSDLDERLRRLALDAAHLASDVGGDARALTRMSDEVLGRVRRLRMRPFADACEALPRAVRDLAAAAGKEVQLDISGGEVEADRAVLDGVREALLHLVRNAVDHGIEPAEERSRLGKPLRGRITVAAALRGDRIVVTVVDDGVGLDVPAIRSLLERRGIPVPSDERELVRAIFEGGLSTRSEPSTISGRGVGLDIVRAAASRIRGSIEVEWQAGAGTTFALSCPPTLASIRALLVVVGSQTFALPTSHVERVLRVRPDEIRRAEGRDVLAGDRPIPLVALARLVPPLPERPVAGPTPVVVLAAGERRLAVAVDELVAEQEIVLQPLGARTRPLPLLSGAAMLGTGRVALVLDPATLVAAGLALGPGGVAREDLKAAERARRSVLVVDDSMTTRTLEQSILEAAGYDVVTAVDGADGWKALQERGADAVVADVEMPRMDGFALCEAIRASKRFKELPVVLLTAMETPEHRARGLEVSADAYIGKSSFDQRALLDTLRDLLAEVPT